MNTTKKDLRFIGWKEACRILGCGRTRFYLYYIANNIITRIPDGGKNVFLAQQVENVVITRAKAAGAL